MAGSRHNFPGFQGRLPPQLELGGEVESCVDVEVWGGPVGGSEMSPLFLVGLSIGPHLQASSPDVQSPCV